MCEDYIHLTIGDWQELVPMDEKSDGINYLVKNILFKYEEYLSNQKKYYNFFHKTEINVPFIIGITGSVAVGKSTLSEKIAQMLKNYSYTVELASTDGFLMSNAELEDKNLMDQKGFPLSFNWKSLNLFLQSIKIGIDKVPYRIYSQEISDLIPDMVEYVEKPDILVIEGINLLQIPFRQNAIPSDYLDYSIYLDSSEDNLKYWFMERFHNLLSLNRTNTDNFYYKWANGPENEANAMALKVWNDINLKNLHDNIAPLKGRADVVVKKEKDHSISDFYFKKY